MQPFETRARYTSTWQDLESIQVDDLNADMSRQVDGKKQVQSLATITNKAMFNAISS